MLCINFCVHMRYICHAADGKQCQPLSGFTLSAVALLSNFVLKISKTESGPEVIKLFSCSTQLSMKFES